MLSQPVAVLVAVKPGRTVSRLALVTNPYMKRVITLLLRSPATWTHGLDTRDAHWRADTKESLLRGAGRERNPVRSR